MKYFLLAVVGNVRFAVIQNGQNGYCNNPVLVLVEEKILTNINISNKLSAPYCEYFNFDKKVLKGTLIVHKYDNMDCKFS